MHATGAELVADASALVALSDTLAAGDAVKRALWSRAGDEEDAVVVAAPSRPGDLVTITLAGSGVTYASEPLRLRKVAPAVVAPAKKSKASKAGSPFEVPLPDQLLPLFATKYAPAGARRGKTVRFALHAEPSGTRRYPEITSNKSLKLNPHAQPGQLLYERFAAAARALGDSKSVDLVGRSAARWRP